MEFDGEGSVCSRCAAAEPELKVLSPDERDDFHGLTIQQGNEREPGPDYPQWPSDGNHEYQAGGPGHRVYVRQVSFGSSMGLLTKLIMVAAVLFLIFVALPLALLIMVVSSILWWLFRR